VAELYGVPLRGYLAWLVLRLYHGFRVPCAQRRLMLVVDWVLSPSRRDPVALLALEHPHAPLREAHRQLTALAEGDSV
jgi:NADH dehydrogenase